MTTMRDIITRAYQRSGLRDSSQSLSASDASFGLSIAQDLIMSLPGMTHWKPVEISEDYTAGENERIRSTVETSITVTIPAAVSSARQVLFCCNEIELACEGYDDRAPKDGARVQITDVAGSTSRTLFYRADTAEWVRADALTLDSDVPLNADMHGALTAILGVELVAAEPNVPVGQVIALAAQDGRSRMRARYGKRQDVAVETALLNTSFYYRGRPI